MKPPTRKHSDYCECDECNAKYNRAPIGATIIFDIETCPQSPERLLAIAPDFQPDKRLKDPEKIKANIEQQKQDFIDRAALHWTTAEIVLIGIGDGVKYAPLTGNESEILKCFFDILKTALDAGNSVGGHNIKGFDLPLIVNRARALKVPLPEGLLSFWRGRTQWHESIFDTLEILSFGSQRNIEGNGVEHVCKALGLRGKLGEGADFPGLWKKNQKGAIAYNQRDVEMEIEIAKFCGYKFQ
jgi:DNA polymerase elongation subunit (family B)